METAVAQLVRDVETRLQRRSYRETTSGDPQATKRDDGKGFCMNRDDERKAERGRPLCVFFSAGEPSGDIHGANLIRQLKAQQGEIECVGYGGPEMDKAGCRLHADLTALAVMWILRVLTNLHKFWGLVSRADRYFRHHRPDAVVLVDYPGFNWWIAAAQRSTEFPSSYYTPPQIWAWAQWRIKKMRRLVDHVLAALPFEAEWFREKGCNATFIGHPFFDEVEQEPLDEAFLARFSRRPRSAGDDPAGLADAGSGKELLGISRRGRKDTPEGP